jgi:hypothetical protein
MKRSQSSVPATETGKIPGDGGGSRSFMQMPTKGGRNATTNESRRAAGGMAPKPSGGAALLGNDRPSHPVQAGLARVKNTGSAASGGIPNPIQKPNSNLRNASVGQPNPNTAAASTAKPKRKGLGSAFFGEY